MSTAGEVLIYDAQGKHVRAMPLPQGTQASPAGGRKGVPSSSASPAAGRGNSKNADDDDDDDDSEDDEKEDRVAKGGVSGAGAERGRVIAVHWYDGAEGLIHQRVPTLCLAFDSGIVQLSRGVDDPDPVVVDAHMAIRKVSYMGSRWYHCSKGRTSERRVDVLVQFFFNDSITALQSFELGLVCGRSNIQHVITIKSTGRQAWVCNSRGFACLGPPRRCRVNRLFCSEAVGYHRQERSLWMRMGSFDSVRSSSHGR